MSLSPAEARVCAAIESSADELVALVRTLIGFDTTTHPHDAPARDEAALQEHVAGRLRSAGLDVDIGEPDASVVAGHRMIPDGYRFDGRPQVVGRLCGAGGGRSLLFNGHVDTVAVEPLEQWAHEPFSAVVEDGVVHGRGACDMKGGVACMVFAAETLARLDIPLRGDLIVNTVTDEESTGAGGLVSARTIAADAAIVPEPSSLDVWIACRGSLLPSILVRGRAGHAGIAPRPPDDGGAVNAIEKMTLVLEALRRLRDEWALQPRHPYLSPADVVPTRISGGEWIVSHPASCTLDCHVEYLPGQADASGWGSRVEEDFTQWIRRAADADPWLAANPPQIDWTMGGVPPAEVAADEPVVQAALGATRAVGRRATLGGLDNWHDGATLVVEAGIPAICLGPGDIQLAHGTAECVPVEDLIDCTKALAVTALRFCGE